MMATTHPTPTPPVPVRLAGIQGLRGFAVLLVIMVHMHHIELKYSKGPMFLGPWNTIGICGVDIFLVVSGFVLTYLAFGNFGQTSYVKAYTFARLSRVYPLYMLLTALLIPIYLMLPGLFNASEGHQVNLVRSLLLIPDVRLPLIPVAWTLHHELYFYVVFCAMLFVPERHLPKALLAWLLVTAALIWWGRYTPRAEQGAFERVFFNPINLNFILGMTAAWALAHGPRRGAAACIGLALAWVAVGYAMWFSMTEEYWVSDFWRVWVFGVPAALFVYGIVLMELQGGPVFLPKLGWIGDGAYSIYLVHLMVVVVVGRLWGSYGVAGVFPHLLFMIASVALSLAVGYAVFQRFEQPMLRFARRHDPTRPSRAGKPAVT